MAQAYDVLAGLNRMLESQERREQTRLQTSLAMMQFAQSKRMQDIQVAGQQLQMLQTANTQMMASQAQSFLSATGWGGYYNAEEDDWAEDFKDDLVKLQTKGGYGFSDSDANRIVSSVNAVYAGSPEGLLGIAEELHGLLMPDEKGERRKLTESEQKFVTGFDIIGMVDKQADTGIVTVTEKWAQPLDDISRTLENKRSITQEMYEFGRGEFDIQRGIGLTEDVSLPTFKLPKPEEPEDTTKPVADLAKIIGEHESTNVLKNVKQNVYNLESEISNLKNIVLKSKMELNSWDNAMNKLDRVASIDDDGDGIPDIHLTSTQQSLLIPENRESARAAIEKTIKTSESEMDTLLEELDRQERARNLISPSSTRFFEWLSGGTERTTKAREKQRQEDLKKQNPKSSIHNVMF